MLNLPVVKWALAGVMLFAGGAVRGDEPKAHSPQPSAAEAAPLDQEALEKKFTETLSGVVFAGSYSVTVAGAERPAQMEKYTISKVTKVKDDYWRFEARIQYGGKDVTLPLVLQVKWAGDTPVITLTELTIPLLGTFTSRVMIYGDRYAGTWQHDKVGGHLWGRLEKLDKSGDANATGAASGSKSEKVESKSR